MSHFRALRPSFFVTFSAPRELKQQRTRLTEFTDFSNGRSWLSWFMIHDCNLGCLVDEGRHFTVPAGPVAPAWIASSRPAPSPQDEQPEPQPVLFFQMTATAKLKSKQ